ncbi:MAG TPA: histidine kinase, partial [Actinomycetota bacterium]
MTSLESTPPSLQDINSLAEPERIARRLHDGFIQSLLSVGMQLRAARGMVDDPEAVSLSVGAAADEIDWIARQLRSYVFVLKPGLISGWELERELRSLAGQLAAGKGVSMAVEVDSLAASTLAARSRTQDVVQAAREAVANTLRHSGSKRLGLTLFLVNGAAMLEIRGEGDELDADAFAGHGHEFSNLRAHARALSAGLEVESRRGDGTRVRVRI